jgi:chemotaxis protein methyltransferase CheR
VVVVRGLANAGELREAGRACATALDRHREVAALHHLHALLLHEAGHAREAAAAARRALYLDPTLVVAHLAYGAALGRLGEHAAARHALDAALARLEALPDDAPVPGSDGERAGRLRGLARTQRALLDRGAE